LGRGKANMRAGVRNTERKAMMNIAITALTAWAYAQLGSVPLLIAWQIWDTRSERCRN